MVDLRRELHRHPEVGLKLPQTQRIVSAALDELGLEQRQGSSTDWITAVIDGGVPGPTVILRADMDGLPLQEDTGLEYASEIPGQMHACGHDLHMAMLVGAAHLLVERQDDLKGRVLLAFQPGEEGHFGARAMISEGALIPAEESVGSRSFALHVFTNYSAGTLYLRPGTMLAASDTIRLNIFGKGGHASAPHLAVNPTTIAAEIVLSLQAIPAYRINATDPAVVTLARLVSGTTPSVIPDSAVVEGTIRTVSESGRFEIHETIARLVEGICTMHSARSDLEIEPGYPMTRNDIDFHNFLAARLVEAFGTDTVQRLSAPVMAAEDFSYFLDKVPGAMVFLGAGPDPGTDEDVPMNHSNLVVFDESVMALGAATNALVAVEWLRQASLSE